MASIKSKQFEIIKASQMIETDDKKFVSQAEKDKWNNNSDSNGNGSYIQCGASKDKYDALEKRLIELENIIKTAN